MLVVLQFVTAVVGVLQSRAMVVNGVSQHSHSIERESSHAVPNIHIKTRCFCRAYFTAVSRAIRDTSGSVGETNQNVVRSIFTFLLV